MKLLFLPYSRSLYNFIEEFDFTCIKSSGMEADKARNWEVISSEYPNL